MAYIGLEPSNSFVSLKRQVITGDGTASYTLDHSVASVNDVAIFVNNVRQDPAGYSISGTALTLGGTIESSDDCYVIFLGQALQTVTPDANTITNTMLQSGSFSNITGVGTLSSGLTLSDNILFDTASKGIYLGVTSATASNLLDDYEEGTWTPVITSGGNTLTVSGGTQFYKYIKVGKMCSLFYNAGNVTVSGTAASGDQRITGIPFQGATNGRQAGTVPMYYTSGGLRYNAKDFMMLNINSGATEIEIVGYDNSSGYANPGTPSTGSGTYFWWQLTYEVA